ncbi:MAG TPA: pseudouridine synthase, partial [Methylovirgula sp.]
SASDLLSRRMQRDRHHERPGPQSAGPRKPKHRPKPVSGDSRPAAPDAAPPTPDRIAKIMARAGLCSRRDAEAWIAQGRVAVNGKTLTSPAVTIGPTDEVSVDGKPLAERQRTRLFLFHKPRGLVTTHKDPEGRTTIFDFLHLHSPEAPRLLSIGRLDINTEGLLLLTNDGGLARILELPSTGWLRRYRVRANGETDQAVLDGLAKGVTIEGVRYAGIEATLDRQQGANCWLTMGLREGKNREIKRVLEHLGLTVNRLIRISFGPFQLSELGEGKIEEVRTRVLRDQLGPALAQTAGVDFDAPVEIMAEKRMAEERLVANRGPRPAPRASARPGTRPGTKSETKADARRSPAKAGSGPHTKRGLPEPEPEKIRSRPQPGPRKHISALRVDEKSRDSERPRRRVETGEIADRKGRAIVIERRSEAKRPANMESAQRQDPGRAAPGRASKSGSPKSAAARFGGRDEARFKGTAPKGDEARSRPSRHGPERSGTPKPGATRSGAPRSDATGGPPRSASKYGAPKPSGAPRPHGAPKPGGSRPGNSRPGGSKPGAGGKGRRPK